MIIKEDQPKRRGMYGKRHTEESKKKISITKTGVKMSDAFRKKCSESKRGSNHHFYGKRFSKEHVRNLSISHIGIKQSKEARKKLSISTTRLWKDPNFVKKIHRSAQIKPNNSELVLLDILNTDYPDEWKYVGDFSCCVDGKNPDFIYNGDEKKAIDLFGNWWHSKEKTGVDENVHERSRINHFKRNGYELLVIWERELDDVDAVRKKIRDFSGGNN